VIIGPFEEYFDEIMGVKRSFEALIGIVLPEETRRLEQFKKYANVFDHVLAEKYEYAPRTVERPMVVVDAACYAGESLYKYLPMACNLPNDPDIHEDVGSKQVFFRNIVEAKFNLITSRIASRVLSASVADKFSSELQMLSLIGHELSHGLTFKFRGEQFGTVASPLEEAKADVFGLLFLRYLAEEGQITHEDADSAVKLELMVKLRQLRFEPKEAHAVGALTQFNSFLRSGMFEVSDDGKVSFDKENIWRSVELLGDTLYDLSQDPVCAPDFLYDYGDVPDELRILLSQFDGIPVDIDPVFMWE